MFVFQLADDLFQHILYGNEAENLTRLVPHHGQWAPFLAEQFQRVGHAVVGVQVQRRIERVFQNHQPTQTEQVKQILGVDHADYFVERAIIHRHPRVGAGPNRFEYPVRRGTEVQGRHPLARHHAVAHLSARQGEHLAHELGLLCREHARLARLLDQHRQFFDRVNVALGPGGRGAAPSEDLVAGAVQQRDERPSQPDEHVERGRDPQ